MKKIIYPMLGALALTGCVSGTMSPPLSESHPANPDAAQATFAPLKPFLMSDTNLAVTTDTSTNATGSGHEHHHEAKPETKTEHAHE